MLKKYGHDRFGKPTDRSFIDIVKQNRADRAMWIRDFIRETISSADINYNGLYQFCAGEVLREWMPKEEKEIVGEINKKLERDLSRNAEKLKELGYDTNGKLLPKPKEEPSEKKDQGDNVIREKLNASNLMKQFKEMKKKHPDSILLFRVGDFYELFGKDAQDASKLLGITLTSRANGKADKIYLAGFPHHALDTYLPKLVRAGRRVAICEQLEDPNKNK